MPLVGAEWVVRGWLYEAANEAVSRSIEEERRREECLSDQLGGDVDDWEEWQSDADRKNQEELFNILDEVDRFCQDSMREMELGEWTIKPVVPEKRRRGRRKKIVGPPKQ